MVAVSGQLPLRQYSALGPPVAIGFVVLRDQRALTACIAIGLLCWHCRPTIPTAADRSNADVAAGRLGHSLLQNGSFAHGMDYWFYAVVATICPARQKHVVAYCISSRARSMY